ncbi:tRNA synthetases class I (E and Q), catalytic domain containing protein [Elaphomyces granulatus]|jgi:glutamyl-tRNA synthetase
MGILIVASKANSALLLPTLLAAAYLTLIGPEQIAVKYEDVESLGTDDEKLVFITNDGDRLLDDAVIRYFLGRNELLAGGKNDLVSEWLGRCEALAAVDFKSLDKPIRELEAHLTLRSYIVGYTLTLADIAVWGVLCGNRVVFTLRRNSININRWFDFIESSNPWISEVVVSLLNTAKQRKAAGSAAGGSYNIGLKNAENGVVTRFPPEPSGYLHIGHAKAALLNDYFAHEYTTSRGALLCRFDDTNPSKESEEFQDSILHDLSLLGVFPDRISYSSDYFQQMYEACVKLIKDRKAYADDTIKEIMQDQRMDGTPSARRDISVEESLARFEDMKTGSEEGLKWCIRAKISVDDPNKALRDPVIYRCNPQPHHRTGTTWKIYPSYDLCAPFLDSFEMVTHALRTNEYRDRNAQYHWMQEAMGLRKVEIWDFSRLNFVKTVLSKRKLTMIVEKGIVWGWDDPRMPTIRGIRRRGMTIPALREFILKQGPSQNIVNLDWTKFWATNKKYIDPVAPRHTAIPKQDAVVAHVTGIEATSSVDKPKHAKNPDVGLKKVFYSKEILFDQADAQLLRLNEEVTLMNWGNAVVINISKDNNTGKVLSLNLELHLENDVKKTEKKVTWLAKDPPENMIPVELVSFDYLITKDKIEKDDDIDQYLNYASEFRTEAWADYNLAAVAEDDIIQFDRVGFFRVDRAYKDGEPAILFNIPTGKA